MKKIVSLGLAKPILAASALAGCSGNKAPENDSVTGRVKTETASASADSTTSGEVTEITWWAFPTFGVDSGYEQELADAFHAANPRHQRKSRVYRLYFWSGQAAQQH